MTDHELIFEQIKTRLDDFWTLGSSTDEKSSDAVSDAFWGAAEDDISWLLDYVRELKVELARFHRCHPYSWCGPNGGHEHLEIRRSNITTRTVYHRSEEPITKEDKDG